MAIGVLKNTTKVAVVEEVTEGTAVDPSAGAEFIQVLDGLSTEPAKEVVERTVITPNKGKIKPRTSTKSGSGSLPLEWKGSGVEGDAPESNVLYKSLLGGRRQITSRITTGTGHTTTIINVPTHSLVKGDFIVILEAGDHSMHFVKAVTDANNIEIIPARDSAPSDAVEIAKSTTYFSSDSEPTFTNSVYWGDEIKEQFSGCRANAMAIENFSTGQIPSANFSWQALSFTEVDGSAPVTPSFDDEVPPLALSVKVFKDADCLDMNELGLNVENVISDLVSVKEASGKVSSRISERAITGSLTPYLDDASVDLFNDFDTDTDFELVVLLGNPSGVAGELDLGSLVGFYCPQAAFTSLGKGDQDGIMTRPAEFQAHAGATGDQTEVFFGFC